MLPNDRVGLFMNVSLFCMLKRTMGKTTTTTTIAIFFSFQYWTSPLVCRYKSVFSLINHSLNQHFALYAYLGYRFRLKEPSSGHNRKYKLKNSIIFVSGRSPPYNSEYVKIYIDM